MSELSRPTGSTTPGPRWWDRAGRSALIAQAAEAIGAHTIADKADRARSDGEILAVTMPALPGDWRATRVKLFRQGGHDQVADAMLHGGWRGFEHPIPSVFRACVARADGIVYDVGANTGIYSLIAAGTTKAPIYGFEPIPEIADMARGNLALNRAAGQVFGWVVHRPGTSPQPLDSCPSPATPAGDQATFTNPADTTGF
jgi:hypothetical protein